MSNFTKAEHYTLMSLWGIFGSPLMIGGNMPENDDFTLSLLQNEEYMLMHKTAQNAKEIERNEIDGKGYIIWTAESEKHKYTALFNTDDKPITVNYSVQNAYDIWQKNTVCTDTLTIEAHGARLLKTEK